MIFSNKTFNLNDKSDQYRLVRVESMGQAETLREQLGDDWCGETSFLVSIEGNGKLEFLVETMEGLVADENGKWPLPVSYDFNDVDGLLRAQGFDETDGFKTQARINENLRNHKYKSSNVYALIFRSDADFDAAYGWGMA
jgi:hypothetical protein